jgi:hypothetical protein
MQKRSVTGITVTLHCLINLRVMEKKSTNNIRNIRGARNANRHQRDVEYEWTRKEGGPLFHSVMQASVGLVSVVGAHPVSGEKDASG